MDIGGRKCDKQSLFVHAKHTGKNLEEPGSYDLSSISSIMQKAASAYIRVHLEAWSSTRTLTSTTITPPKLGIDAVHTSSTSIKSFILRHGLAVDFEWIIYSEMYDLSLAIGTFWYSCWNPVVSRLSRVYPSGPPPVSTVRFDLPTWLHAHTVISNAYYTHFLTNSASTGSRKISTPLTTGFGISPEMWYTRS